MATYNPQTTDRRTLPLRPIALLPLLALPLLALFVVALPAAAQNRGTLVSVDPVVVRQVSETVTVIGRFVARDSGPVAASVAGPVEAFLVEVGDRLELGSVIAVIDASELEARLALAAAQLAQAEALVATAQAEFNLAEQELNRAEGLRGSSAYSPARSEDARARVAIARANVAVAEAAVVARRAEMRLADLELTRAWVEAPYDGVVMRTMTEVGAYVTAGTIVIEMLNDTTLELEADVPFNLLSGLTIDDEVAVILDDGRTLLASVRAVVPSENPLTRTRIVRFTPAETLVREGLAVGQTATLALPTGPAREAVTVHKDAVIPSPQGAVVYIAAQENGVLVAEPRSVVLGKAVGDRFEVVEGLEAGELAIIRGNERLQPGQQLELTG